MFKELQSFGLSEKEAHVYVATLEMGKATVQQISKKADVNRATTYVQLESLKNRGLVSQIADNNKTYYIAESPQTVKRIIEKEKLDVLFKEKQMDKIMPNLQAIFNVAEEKPNVRFYEGRAGVKVFQEEVSKIKTDEINVIWPTLEREADPDDDVLDMLTKNVKRYNLIYISEKKLKSYDDIAKNREKMKFKHIPTSKLDIKTEIVIYGDKVWINKIQGKDLAVVIEDKIIAQSFLALYKFLWNS